MPTAIAAPALVPTPIAGDPTHATIHRLANGMTVYLATDRTRPTVVAHIVVHAGSANDPATSTGLAHYLEHMILFKGTRHIGTLDYAREAPALARIAALYDDLRKPAADRDGILAAIDRETQTAAALEVPNEMDQLYRRLGITGMNAWTDLDATVYTDVVPHNRLAQWAEVETQRFSEPVFRLFWPELEAVYEEKNRGLDDPGRRTYEALVGALFAGHAYAQPTLGEIEHLKTPAFADMVAFFTRYYTPANMAIVLAGDVDATILPVLERTLGAWQRPAGPALALPAPSPVARSRAAIEVAVPANPGVVIGWQLPPATGSPDRSALEVMDAILLEDGGGMVARDLLLPQVVAAAGCAPTFRRTAGYYELWADALAAQPLADVEARLAALVGKLGRGEFTDADLRAAQTHVALVRARSLETDAGREALLETAFIHDEPWAAVVGEPAAIAAVTRADVVRVATRYLAADREVVVHKVLGQPPLPKIGKPRITPIALDPTRESAAAAAIRAEPVAPIAPQPVVAGVDYARADLPSGPLVAVHNAQNALFSVTYAWAFGRDDDRLACFALEAMKVAGAGARTPEATADALYQRGLTVDVACDRQTSSITLAGPDEAMADGLAIVTDWLAHPALDRAILGGRIAATLTARANTKTSPAQIARASQQLARWGTASDYLVVAPSTRIAKTTPAEVAAILAGYLRRAHRTLYFGPRDVSGAPEVMLGGRAAIARAPRSPAKYRPANRAFVTPQDTAQTQIWLLWPRAPATAAERAVGTLFGHYIGTLIFRDVREARGLAYTAYGGYEPGVRAGDDAYLYAFAGVQADKTSDAIAAIRDVMARPIDAGELAVARAELAENLATARIEPRALAQTVFAWDDEGATGDPRAARTAAALAVDQAQLTAWVTAAIGRPVIVSVVGDPGKLDRAALARVAPVTDLPVASIFAY